MSGWSEGSAEGLLARRRELEDLDAWPEVSPNGAVLLYDVCMALGLTEEGAGIVLGSAWFWLQESARGYSLRGSLPEW